eukprot:2201004-Amphidinium_carterae.1
MGAVICKLLEKQGRRKAIKGRRNPRQRHPGCTKKEPETVARRVTIEKGRYCKRFALVWKVSMIESFMGSTGTPRQAVEADASGSGSGLQC